MSLLTISQGQLRTTVQDGAWNTPATWDCGCVPSALDSVRIAHSVEIMTDHEFLNAQVHVLAGGDLYNTLPLTINTSSMFLNDGHVLFMGTITMSGWFENHGLAEFVGDVISGATIINAAGALMRIEGDFENQYILDGSGSVCVTDSTINTGYFTGAFDFCDASPTTTVEPIIDVNITGVVAPTVTFCANGACITGLVEEPFASVTIGPNPFGRKLLLTTADEGVRYTLHSADGRLLHTRSAAPYVREEIPVDDLSRGCYLLRLSSADGARAKVLRVVRE